MTRINLLPPEERAKASRERGLSLVVLALVVVVAVLGLAFLYTNRQVSNKQSEVDSVQGEIEQVNQQVAALQQYEALQSQRQQMSETAKGIFDGRLPWSNICEELSLLIPEDCYLVAMTATVPPEMQPGGSLTGAEAPAASGTESTDITLTGKARTHEAVAEFMTRLGLMPQITNISLGDAQKDPEAAQTTGTGGTTSTASGPRLVSFTINVTLRRFLVSPPLAVSSATAPTASGGQ